MAQRDVFVSVSHRGVLHVVWIPRVESSSLTYAFLKAFCDGTGRRNSTADRG
jgi:hypothetical protein